MVLNFCQKTCEWVIILIHKPLDWSPFQSFYLGMGGFLVNGIELIVILPFRFMFYCTIWKWVCFCLSKSQLYSADGQFSKSVATHPWIQMNLEWPQCNSPVPVYICVTRTDDICECDITHQKFMAHSL